jgi:hypothetical protein
MPQGQWGPFSVPRQPEKNRPSTVLTVAYFDTSAWSHLYNGAILKRPGWEAVATPFDLSMLRKAVSDRIISILLSVVALEELISEPEDYRPRAKLALDFSDWSRPLKPTSILLTDTIKSYASCGRASASVFKGAEQWEWVRGLPALILGGTEGDVAARRDVLRIARAQINKFHTGMVESQKWALTMFEQHPGVSEDWTFERYWKEAAVRFAEDSAQRVGVLDECRARGIEGLLEIPAVRMAVGAALSLIFAQAREKSAQAPRPQDSRDLQHAVMAASRATVFVTDDGKLLRTVKRVPMKHFEALRLQNFSPDCGLCNLSSSTASLHGQVKWQRVRTPYEAMHVATPPRTPERLSV